MRRSEWLQETGKRNPPPACHKAFSPPSRETGHPFQDHTVLNDRLCEHHKRTVGSDNCVLPIPADRHGCHWVKVLHYADDCPAIQK